MNSPREVTKPGHASAFKPPEDPRERLVLIADDSPEFRYGVRKALETAGYRVLEASTGEEALDVIIDQRLSILLLDLVMPGLNGVELLRELQKRSVRELHIVAMSGVIAIDEKVEGTLKSLGVACVIQKPIEMNHLLAVLK